MSSNVQSQELPDPPAAPTHDRGISLRQRLILTIVIVGVMTTLPAIYALSRLRTLNHIATAATRTHGRAYRAVGRYGALLGDVNRIEASYVASPDARSVPTRDSAIHEAGMYLDTLAAAGYGSEARPARAHYDRIVSSVKDIDALIARGLKDDATASFERVKDQFAAAQTTNENILAAIDTLSANSNSRATAIGRTAASTTALALAACIAIALAIGAWMTRNLLRPIAQLRHAMARVAGGSFDVPDNLPYRRSDEIGDVSRSFRGMTQRLADLDKLKAEFMSISTHELKTPINVIGGYAELIQEGVYGPVTEKQDTALKSIREQARVLTQMVNQLLDVSRIEAGGMRLEMHQVVVRDLLERVQRTFIALARKQDIQFEVHVADDTPKVVPGDSDRLRDQVLGNLISNALKFTPSGGRVEVRAWSKEEWLYICVSDTGPGIPEEQQAHVFDKFYQVGGQARSKGAGLGLTIAHEIVHGHGGEIYVTSKPGDGTTFEMRLPTTRAQAEEAHVAREARVNAVAAEVAAEPER
jgi:signal transduction histidine kinase